MSYPNVIYGDYGDEKVAQAAKIGSLPLGQLMILPDGRKFRLAQAGASALSAGVVVGTSAGIVNHGMVAASGLIASATTTHNAVGNTNVILLSNTAVAGAVTASQYADGFLHIQDDTGEGYVYRVKDNTAAVSSAATAFTVTLEPTDGLKVALNPNTTTCSLRKNLFKDAILYSQGTIIAPLIGATPVAVSASFYFWCQRSGPVSLRTGASTLVDGALVIAASATAGSVTVPPTTADTSTVVAAYNLAIRAKPIGYAMETVTATEQALVDLHLE